MTRRKTPAAQRARMYVDVTNAYRRHAGSTTQRQDAAAELGLDLPTFKAALAAVRQMGFIRPNE